LTAKREIQVSWRVVRQGEASPKRDSFDEKWLTDSRITDADIVCCNTIETECLSPADSVAEFSRLPNLARSILVVVPRRSAPRLEQSWDGEVGSFITSVGLFRAFRKSSASESSSCFDLLYWALDNRSHGVSFECLQVPVESGRSSGETPQGPGAQWIIPHKGPLFMLETCLKSVGESRGGADVVSVCFDEETTDAHHELAERFPWVEFYRSRPHSIGPYVSRERFLRSGAAPLVVFQDSDDAPTVSRRRMLISKLLETDADLIGSHEIHVNEIWRQVHAVRYPVNVSAALAASEGHTLLLPTSAGRREAIKAAGGFSTNRTFNSDLEFVFRAFFFLKLRNVDEFLYIRRVRAGSLTQAPETGILSPAREAHSAALRNDLGRIKRKELTLEESALRTQHRSDFGEVRIDRLRRGEVGRGFVRDAWRLVAGLAGRARTPNESR